MMARKAVLWDMDGTLLDSEHLHVSALAQAMLERQMQVPDDLADRVTGLSAEDVYSWLCSDYGLDLAFENWITLKYKTYMGRLSEVREFPASTTLWNDLHAAGIGQAIVSNSDRIIVDGNIGHLGLIAPKLISISRNDVREGKPAPEPYLRGAWLLEVDPGDCIVLEDSPTGALAGLAAGMETYLVPHTALSPPSGVRKLADMAEVAALVGL